MAQVAEGAANENVYDKKRMSFRLGRAITMMLRGNSCFDFTLYRARSRDLPGDRTDEQTWDHFVHDGQFEGRPFRCCMPHLREFIQNGAICRQLPVTVCLPHDLKCLCMRRFTCANPLNNPENAERAFREASKMLQRALPAVERSAA